MQYSILIKIIKYHEIKKKKKNYKNCGTKIFCEIKIFNVVFLFFHEKSFLKSFPAQLKFLK